MLDNIFVLTLEHRLDRQMQVKKELEKFNLSYSFFYGVNGHETNYEGPLLKGEWGVRLSHLKLLQYAQDHNLESFTVLEDDVVFDPDFARKLSEIDIPEDWDLFYLGGAHKIRPVYVKPYLAKALNTVTLHSVCVKYDVYEKLIISILNNPDCQADNAYALLQPEVNAYVTIPHLAWQSDGYSDIQNRLTKYDWLKH